MTLYVHPSGAGTTYTQASPGPLLGALARVAPGETIYMMGTPADQFAPVSGAARTDQAGWTTHSKLTNAPGHSPWLGRLSVRQSWLACRGVKMKEKPGTVAGAPDESLLYLFNSANNYALEDSQILSTGVFVAGADNGIIRRNRISGLKVADGTQGTQVDGIQIKDQATDWVVEHNTIEDFPYVDFSGFHPDGIHIFNASRILVRWNTIRRIGNAGVMFSGDGLGVNDVLLYGNEIDQYIGAQVDGSVFKNVAHLQNTYGSARLGATTEGIQQPGAAVDRCVIRYLSTKASWLTNCVIVSWNQGFGEHPALTAGRGNITGSTTTVDGTFPREALSPWAASMYDGRDRFGASYAPTNAGHLGGVPPDSPEVPGIPETIGAYTLLPDHTYQSMFGGA